MHTRTCGECGNSFETVMAPGQMPGLTCGQRSCPSAGGGTGKPPKTTARGRPIDDRKARAGHRRPASGPVNQRSTGFDLLDGCLPAVVALLAGLAALGSLAAWGSVELVAGLLS